MNSNKEVSIPIRNLENDNKNHNILADLEKKNLYFNGIISQIKNTPNYNEEKFLLVVQRILDLEEELKLSGINVPKDNVLFEKIVLAMLKDYPNTDLQIVATSSRRITTTKMSYDEVTPGMDNKTDDEVMKTQRKLLNEICEKEYEKETDGMTSQDNIQQSEKVDEGYTEDNGDVTSKRMTHTIVTTQTTYLPEHEFPNETDKKIILDENQSGDKFRLKVNNNIYDGILQTPKNFDEPMKTSFDEKTHIIPISKDKNNHEKF
uniref:Death domain-containing protein n=1 Tax=Strongyloides stercoralis TaxID=6248 RepID=A0AAF5DNF2_STRER